MFHVMVISGSASRRRSSFLLEYFEGAISGWHSSGIPSTRTTPFLTDAKFNFENLRPVSAARNMELQKLRLILNFQIVFRLDSMLEYFKPATGNCVFTQEKWKISTEIGKFEIFVLTVFMHSNIFFTLSLRSSFFFFF